MAKNEFNVTAAAAGFSASENRGEDTEDEYCSLDDEREFLLKEEKRVRSLAESRRFAMFLLSLCSSFKVFCFHLITFEAMFNASLAAIFTSLAYFSDHENEGTGFLGSMDFILLGFTIVLPLSATIRFAFRRREQALASIAKFKSASQSLYSCHATWNWGKAPNGDRKRTESDSGGEVNLLQHADDVMDLLIDIGDTLSRYLTLPTASLPFHRVLDKGRREASRTTIFGNRLYFSHVTRNMTRLTLLLEDLKLMGLTASETSRARQWEQYMVSSIEELRMVKGYRTPQGLRCFITVATFFLPSFYGPTFAAIGREMNSFMMGLAFAIIASLALSCLHECVRALEDPFVGHVTLDGIDVNEELSYLHYENLIHTRDVAFPDAPDFHGASLIQENEGRDGNDEKKIVNTADPKFENSEAFDGGMHKTIATPIREGKDDSEKAKDIGGSGINKGQHQRSSSVASSSSSSNALSRRSRFTKNVSDRTANLYQTASFANKTAISTDALEGNTDNTSNVAILTNEVVDRAMNILNKTNNESSSTLVPASTELKKNTLAASNKREHVLSSRRLSFSTNMSELSLEGLDDSERHCSASTINGNNSSGDVMVPEDTTSSADKTELAKRGSIHSLTNAALPSLMEDCCDEEEKGFGLDKKSIQMLSEYGKSQHAGDDLELGIPYKNHDGLGKPVFKYQTMQTNHKKKVAYAYWTTEENHDSQGARKCLHALHKTNSSKSMEMEVPRRQSWTLTSRRSSMLMSKRQSSFFKDLPLDSM